MTSEDIRNANHKYFSPIFFQKANYLLAKMKMTLIHNADFGAF